MTTFAIYLKPKTGSAEQLVLDSLKYSVDIYYANRKETHPVCNYYCKLTDNFTCENRTLLNIIISRITTILSNISSRQQKSTIKPWYLPYPCNPVELPKVTELYSAGAQLYIPEINNILPELEKICNTRIPSYLSIELYSLVTYETMLFYESINKHVYEIQYCPWSSIEIVLCRVDNEDIFIEHTFSLKD